MVVHTIYVREKSDQKVPPLREPNSNKISVFGVIYEIAKQSPV